MIEAGIGRLLVASLHQGIADLLPTRLEFYESWLNPSGLRDGRIGLAPLAAVLSFLRQEGEPYRLIVGRAGEYTAEWTVADMSGYRRAIVRAAPPALRVHLVMGIARTMIRTTYRGSRAIVKWKKGKGAIDIRGSIFCEVRDRTEQQLRQVVGLDDAAIQKVQEMQRQDGRGFGFGGPGGGRGRAGAPAGGPAASAP